LKLDELITQIKIGKIAPLYLLRGIEKYLHQEAIKAFQSTLDESTLMFNWAEYSVASQGINAVLTTASEYAIFGGRRIVIARDFEKVSEEELEELKDYLKNPQPTTSLIFQAEELDKRRSISTALVKACQVVDLNAFNEREAVDWVMNYLRQHKYQITQLNAGLLVAVAGTDLFTLKNELEKLMAYLGKAGLISSQDIEILVARAKEHSNFELGDAIIAKDTKATLRLLTRQLTDRAEPILLLAVMARTFRQMLIALELMEKKVSADEIARTAGIPPFRITDFLSKVRRWDINKVTYAVKRMSTVDNALKSSLGKPSLQLEFLLCEIMGS
jgi:DNA polymerase III subunit delta